MKAAVIIAALVLSSAAGAQSMDEQVNNVDTVSAAQQAWERSEVEQQKILDAAAYVKAQQRADRQYERREAYADAQAQMDIQQRRAWVNRTNDLINAEIRRSDNESRRGPSSYLIVR
jgi:hypothetical protein